jgi:hypothetical protein
MLIYTFVLKKWFNLAGTRWFLSSNFVENLFSSSRVRQRLLLLTTISNRWLKAMGNQAEYFTVWFQNG